MKTFWRSFGKKRRETQLTLACLLTLGLATACTSSRDSAPLDASQPQRTYRATPTVRDMNEQASSVNRKVNIEGRTNDPGTRPPGQRTQRVLPGRQPVRPDTTSTRAPQDTVRRQ